MFGGRERAVLDRGDVARNSFVDARGTDHEVLDEAGFVSGEYADQIMQYKYLTIAVRACANSDRAHAS